MVLYDDKHINAAKRTAETVVIAVALAASQAIDNEAMLANNIYRKIRRIRAQNLDGNTVRVQFCTQDAAGANDAVLPFSLSLDTLQDLILDPENNKVLARFLSTLLARRFSAFLIYVAGPAIFNGVEINIDYWDDITI